MVWHFRHDVVALLAGGGKTATPAADSGKSEGGFFSRKIKVCAAIVAWHLMCTDVCNVEHVCE